MPECPRPGYLETMKSPLAVTLAGKGEQVRESERLASLSCRSFRLRAGAVQW